MHPELIVAIHHMILDFRAEMAGQKVIVDEHKLLKFTTEEVGLAYARLAYLDSAINALQNVLKFEERK